MWNWFRRSGDHLYGTRTPLTPQEANSLKPSFAFVHVWKCGGCGAWLRIRAREDRKGGPSNYRPVRSPRDGQLHSALPSHELTWNGMAEERGWRVDPVRCPACLAGLSKAEYRERRRG